MLEIAVLFVKRKDKAETRSKLEEWEATKKAETHVKESACCSCMKDKEVREADLPDRAMYRTTPRLQISISLL